MRKAFKTIAIVTVFLTTMLALAFTAGAGLGGFSASPVIPENQDPNASMATFDFWVTPGMQQEISVNIANQRDEPITVEVNLFTAGTNMNGIIDYFPNPLTDDSIPFRFEDIATLPSGADNLEIPARTVATVPINISVPPEGFDGMTLGAVHVLLGITEEERAQAGMIVNRFANAIPVRMRVEGSPRVEEPDFYLGEITAEVVSHRAAIIARIHHLAPRMTMGATTSTWIFPAGSDVPIFSHEYMPTDFAPNAIFPSTMMDLAGYGIQPGNYLARVRIEYDGRVWELERSFTVQAQAAQEVNAGAFNQQVQMPVVAGGGLSTLTIVLIIIGALLIILAVIMLLKSRKNKSETPQWVPPQTANTGTAQPSATEVSEDTKAALDNLLKGKSEAEILEMLKQAQNTKPNDSGQQ